MPPSNIIPLYPGLNREENGFLREVGHDPAFIIMDLVNDDRGAEVIEVISGWAHEKQLSILCRAGTLFYLAENGQANALMQLIRKWEPAQQSKLLWNAVGITSLIENGQAGALMELIRTWEPAMQRKLLSRQSNLRKTLSEHGYKDVIDEILRLPRQEPEKRGR